jgi:hypothetical protein
MDRPRKPLHAADHYIYPEETDREYLKLTGFILFLLLLSVVLTWGRGWGIKYLFQDFVATLLISSAAYKMLRLEIFVKIFQSYDLLSHRWPFWAYLYPFVELIIGADYLLSNGSLALYFITLVFTGLTLAAKLKQEKGRIHLQYACLDTMIRLPIFTINYVVAIIAFSTTILIAVFS